MKIIVDQVSTRLKNLKQIRENYRKNKKAIPAKEIKAKKEKTKKEVLELQVSGETVVKILVIIALFYAAMALLLQLSSILIMTGIAFFLSIGLSPVVSRLETLHLPRPIAILVLYIGFFGIIGIMFTTVIPIVIEQLLDITKDFRNLLTNNPVENNSWLSLRLREANFDPQQLQTLLSQNATDLANQLRGFAGSTLGIVGSLFAGIFNVIFTLVLMFFILLEREKVGHFAMKLLPDRNQDYWVQQFSKVQGKMADWFKGRLILMCSLGAFMYLGMKIFEVTMDMKYAATVSIVTAVMSLFPYIGVLITGALCVLIAVNISWTLVIAVLIWVGLSQILEGNILEPMIMEKTTGLSPVVVLLALSAGAILGSALGGIGLAIMGMIFAIPVAASVAIFVNEHLDQ